MTDILQTWCREAGILVEEARASGLLTDGDVIDHLAVKCLTTTEFEDLEAKLDSVGVLLGKVEINGRPIASYLMNQPLQVLGHSVPVLELCAPKPGEQKQGFDHIEVVISESFQERRERSPQAGWGAIRWPSIINPELAMTQPAGDVKFHFTSLQDVIKIEESKPEILHTKVPHPGDFKTWFFDLDGTLISSFQSIVDGVWLYTKEKGLECSRDQVLAAARPTYESYLEELEGEPPKAKDMKLLQDCEARCTDSVVLLRPMLELLDEVKSCGGTVHLWTARFRPSVELILKRYGLWDHFDQVLTSTEVRKPSKIDWISELGDSAILVGDSGSDEECARLNGLVFLKFPKLES